MKRLKRFVKIFFNSLGFDLKRINPEVKNLSFDEILKQNLSQDPLILDVGANKGQTIRRFLDLFDNPTIHAFEPVEEAIQKIRENSFQQQFLVLIRHCHINGLEQHLHTQISGEDRQQ